MGFTEEQVAMFIAFTGVLSVLSQTVLMTHMIDKYGGKSTILIGLLLQATQLILLGFCKRSWMMWLSGIIASVSSITYPSISAYISTYADADKQGLVQGLITGVRSLCGGIGPAMFGLLFNIFDVELDMYKDNPTAPVAQNPSSPFISTETHQHHSILNPTKITGLNPHDDFISRWVVGPPFLFGGILVLLAVIAATFIPDTIMPYRRNSATKSTSPTNYYRYTTVSGGENGTTTTSILTSENANGLLDATNCELLEDMEE